MWPASEPLQIVMTENVPGVGETALASIRVIEILVKWSVVDYGPKGAYLRYGHCSRSR